MEKLVRYAVLAVAGLALVLGFGMKSDLLAQYGPPARNAPVQQSGTANVRIVDFSFNPSMLTVPAGTTVQWTNDGGAPHTVTSTSGSPAFDSGTIDSGGTFKHTFTTAGEFSYRCDIHPSMKGKIIVTEAQTGIGLKLVADSLTSPIAFGAPEDGTGRLFIVDQIGLIKILTSDGELLKDPFLDLRDRMVKLSERYDERGLLGLAFHPDFTKNGRFFVYYSAPLRMGGPEGWNHTSHISEFRVSPENPNKTDLTSERIILQVDEPQANHNGGQLAFGPDGYLYIAVGDGGAANDVGLGHSPSGNGQDLWTLLGKILRIDVNANVPYGIPASNPFRGQQGARAEIFAYGFRNPYRFSFDAGANHDLVVADVGQNLFEEVDIVTRGGNYGWNIKEGTHCFDSKNPNQSLSSCPSTGARGEPLIGPVIEYDHKIGSAVVGGFIYRGSALSQFAGRYLFGDWSASFSKADGKLLVATTPAVGQGMWATDELKIATTSTGKLDRAVLAFGQDVHRELYVLTTENIGPMGTTGKVFKIIPAP